MDYTPATLWRTPPLDHLARLDALLDANLGKAPLRVYCRADDVGLGGAAFRGMIELFGRRELPLALAVVPSWLPLGKTRLLREIDPSDPLWTLHQHGFSHKNTALEGKKNEFGQGLSGRVKEERLAKGRDVLRQAFGENFVPLFTPPWNRCDAETLDILARLGFSGVSRWQGALPAAPATLLELPVNLDLHIRKEQDPEAQLGGLLAELRSAFSLGYLGIMLHHQRQTPHSQAFLGHLLDRLAASPRTRFQSARSLLIS